WSSVCAPCTVVQSGLMAQDGAESMKFVDGVMIHTRDSINYYIDTTLHHVLLRSHMLGVKVKMMLSWDPCVKNGPKKSLLDHRSIVDSKDEILSTISISRTTG
uniref:Uncharacterized protein n=1 Tax=Equus asinus TaxID=9793 RepID=A0A8C4N6Y0_EQUAS